MILFKYFSFLQYLKNIIIFIPLFFEYNLLLDSSNYLIFLSSFTSLCVAAQSIYILNDLKDKDSDKIIGKKNIFNRAERPIRTSEIIICLSLLSLFNIFLLYYLFLYSVVIVNLLISYYLINFSYNYFLKKIIYLDVILIASLYVIRILIGLEFLSERNSYNDSVIYIFLGSLFLLSTKRYIYHSKISLLGNTSITKFTSYNKKNIKYFLYFSFIIMNVFCFFFLMSFDDFNFSFELLINLLLQLLVLSTSYFYMKDTLSGHLGLDIVKNILKFKYLIPATIFIILYILFKT